MSAARRRAAKTNVREVRVRDSDLVARTRRESIWEVCVSHFSGVNGATSSSIAAAMALLNERKVSLTLWTCDTPPVVRCVVSCGCGMLGGFAEVMSLVCTRLEGSVSMM